MTDKQDRLFARNRAMTSGFRFDEEVVKVFPDMIARSVPGYELIVPMIGLLARRYAQPDSVIYDLGCSLGAASLAMSLAVKASGARIVAVDSSAAMVEQCQQHLAKKAGAVPVDVRLEDMLDTRIENASVVVLNFTLQFLDREQRQALINQVAAGMRKGGALVLSEKICFEDEVEQAEQTAWHHDFKRAQGYSELEIAQKRNALEEVLRPDTEARHLQRLHLAGLRGARRWFQCFSFASYIAFK
ncbi:MAG: carboxy-S-adenosyl-L-methionine synthase CmoA [Gammaproteobacteria bacterium]|nr:carboxy-S-adenosyl-L-methionine synthase CmoA [Gammaproteobacteria bacterium]MBT8076618.1 carboxy-S-adenosyl-L-methionine synthase CmoA [Gammaproteobacteria bacterium]NNK99563.1 carboxy-S-adenosyl-L-methionine synthase CmoA [Xanthomonadales bacterium]